MGKTTIKSTQNNDYVIALVEETLTDGSYVYSVKVVANLDTKAFNHDAIFDCIDLATAEKIYETLSSIDIINVDIF